MNNKDIREYKVEVLNLGDNDKNKSKSSNRKKIEIKNLNYNLSIDKGGIYDKYLKKLDGGLKYYNILKYFYANNKQEDMISFVKETKNHIKKNLEEFFDLEDDCSIIKSFKIFIFTTDVEYNEEEFKKIKDYIPFKYFYLTNANQMKINEVKGVIPKEQMIKRNNNIIIKYSFELVEEAMNEIYLQIINTNSNLYNIFTKDELDGGAKGKFFEKIITYYLNIDSSIYENTDQIHYFNDYPIKFHEELEVLIPNNNEKIENKPIKKKLENGIYLFSQRRYNGRAIDIAIVNIQEQIHEIIGIQVSIHKDKIYDCQEIKTFLIKLKENIENSYELPNNREKLYFSYLFEYKTKDKYSDMINKCTSEKIGYFFFDVTNKIFVNDSGEPLKILSRKLYNPFSLITQKPYKKTKSDYKNIKDFYFLNYRKNPQYKINNEQEISIKNIIIEEMKLTSSIQDIHYQYAECCFLSSDDLKKEKVFFISKNNIFGEINMIINEKKYLIDLKGAYSSIKENIEIPKTLLFDCYKIK